MADFKHIIMWDRVCRRYTFAEVNIILLLQKNVNQEVFSGFLARIASCENKPDDPS